MACILYTYIYIYERIDTFIVYWIGKLFWFNSVEILKRLEYLFILKS